MPRLTSATAFILLAAAVAAPAPLVSQQVARDSSTRTDTATRATRIAAVEIRASASGQGTARTANAVGPAELRLAPAGTSAFKVIERLPGVNAQSSDPFGMYEWSNRITIRGFQTQQIGQTFDGIPLGDMSYGNFNGLGIARAVDPENLAAATVQQGTGALGTSSANNLGGVVQYQSTEPRPAFGVTLRQLVGSANSRKSFGRIDLGARPIGSGAFVAGFVSLSRMDNDKWKGAGEQYSPVIAGLLDRRGIFGGAGETWQDQANVKLQLLAGEHKFTAFYDFADRKEADYVDLSLDRWRASGSGWDQYTTWQAAKQGAQSAAQDEAYFMSAQGARRDHLAYLAADLRLAENAHLIVTPYAHSDTGAGDWHAPAYGTAANGYRNAWSPDPIYFRQTQYQSDRYGVNARTVVGIRGQRLEGGVWYEDNTARIRRVAWRLADYAASPTVDRSNVIRLFFDRTGELATTVTYLQNTSELLSQRLALTYGVKYLRVDAKFRSNGQTIANAATFGDPNRPALSAPTKGGILPQVAALYQLSGAEQLFVSYAENVNQFPYSPQSGIYNTNPAAFDYFKANTDPEHARTYEAGVRTRRERVEGSLAGYFIDYRNRLIGVSVCPLTATCVSSFANVGSVTTRGVEALLRYRLVPALSWEVTGSYNASTFDDDYVAGRDASGNDIRVPAKGKDMVDAPRVMAASRLMYDDGAVTASFGGRHVDKRYFSILNQSSVPAYTVFDAAAAYTLKRLAAAKELRIGVNLVNIFDESYISTVGTGGFSVGAAPDLQTLQAGVPRQLFVTIGTTF